MKKSMINITLDSKYAEVLFEDQTTEKINITQPKFELYSSAKLQLEKLTKTIKKNTKIGFVFVGGMWLILPFQITNAISGYSIFSNVVHANIASLTLLLGIVSMPFYAKSIYTIIKRDIFTNNIQKINDILDDNEDYEVSKDFFIDKNLSVVKKSPEYEMLFEDLYRELKNNPIKQYTDWEFMNDNDTENNFEHIRRMNEKSFAEEVQFEMVSNSEKKLVKSLKR